MDFSQCPLWLLLYLFLLLQHRIGILSLLFRLRHLLRTGALQSDISRAQSSMRLTMLGKKLTRQQKSVLNMMTPLRICTTYPQFPSTTSARQKKRFFRLSFVRSTTTNPSGSITTRTTRVFSMRIFSAGLCISRKHSLFLIPSRSSILPMRKSSE